MIAFLIVRSSCISILHFPKDNIACPSPLKLEFKLVLSVGSDSSLVSRFDEQCNASELEALFHPFLQFK